jgi:predicted enzyme related to lactoylglutathione lyase
MKNPMDLGEYFPCLDVEDLQASIDFYQKLGFEITSDERKDNWAVLQHNNMALCLYQGHIDSNLINFRGGDINEIAEQIKEAGLALSKPAITEEDGSQSAEVMDPDGNVIYFNTFPDERVEYLKSGKLIDY